VKKKMRIDTFRNMKPFLDGEWKLPHDIEADARGRKLMSIRWRRMVAMGFVETRMLSPSHPKFRNGMESAFEYRITEKGVVEYNQRAGMPTQKPRARMPKRNPVPNSVFALAQV
jgi:hypothetical protein